MGVVVSGKYPPPSLSQWAPLLKQCSGLLFFGAERMMAHFPPSQLVSLSMQGIHGILHNTCRMIVYLLHTHVECSVAIVVDHMQTPTSSLTQSKLDIQKRYQKDRQNCGSTNLIQCVWLVAVQWAGSPYWAATAGCCSSQPGWRGVFDWLSVVHHCSDQLWQHVQVYLWWITCHISVVHTDDTVWSLLPQPYFLKQSVLVICTGRQAKRDRKRVTWRRPWSMSLCILRMERL